MLDTIDLKNKTVLVRLDLNVPVNDANHVTDFTRIDRVKPTMEELRKRGAKIIILSHFGRPKGGPDKKYSLEFLAPVLSERWGMPVSFEKDGNIVLKENMRFNPGEEKDDTAFAASLAKLGDFYVNDAFSVSHRAHASVHAIANLLPADAGLTMRAELSALDAAISNPEKPVAAIVGGSKISTKLDLLGNLVTKMDVLVLGGGMANTFAAAKGCNPQKSLFEPDMLDTARKIWDTAEEHGCQIILPVDCVAAADYAADAEHHIVDRNAIPAGWQSLDIGPESVTLIQEALADCKTILWNGPVGVFEMPAFAHGTNNLAQWVSARTKARKVVSVAGGGDTVAALSQAGVADDFTYVSTAGGAFLEWLEGKELPGVAILAKRERAA